MKKMILTVALAVFICCSLTILLMDASAVRDDGVNDTVAQLIRLPMDAQTRSMQEKLVRWYNLNLTSGQQDPGFSEAYRDILDLTDHAMGYISVPSQGLRLPVYHGAEAAGEEGAGHLQQTAFPVGEENTHSAVQVAFSLEEGDYFYLHMLQASSAYRVGEVSVLSPEEIAFDAREGAALCTLVMPVGEQVLLMQGEYVESAPAEEEITVRAEDPSDGFLVAACLVLALGILLVPFLVWWGK